MQGTTSQLEFLPESSTDFIFAVIAEETGLIGVGLLLLCYGLIIARGLYLALHLTDRFARIMVASILLTLFINVFVNIGMVSGTPAGGWVAIGDDQLRRQLYPVADGGFCLGDESCRWLPRKKR